MNKLLNLLLRMQEVLFKIWSADNFTHMWRVYEMCCRRMVTVRPKMKYKYVKGKAQCPNMIPNSKKSCVDSHH